MIKKLLYIIFVFIDLFILYLAFKAPKISFKIFLFLIFVFMSIILIKFLRSKLGQKK